MVREKGLAVYTDTDTHTHKTQFLENYQAPVCPFCKGPLIQDKRMLYFLECVQCEQVWNLQEYNE